MSLWFLKQTDRLGTVQEYEDLRGGIDNSRIEVNEDEEVGSTIYPPYDEIILKTMMQYLQEFKRYDADDIRRYRLVNKALVPIHLMPTETVCHDCNSQLSKPIKLTHDTKILSFQGINILSISTISAWYS